MPLTRRELIRTAALTGGGVAVATTAVAAARRAHRGADATGDSTVRALATTEPSPDTGEDPLVRMQRELVQAMGKPVEERSWGMVIDRRKCVGCHACTVACIAENHLPPGVVYRPVVVEERGEFPRVSLRYTPRPCMHCDEPPCVSVCPVSATWKRPDGVVAMDYDACIGCRYCATACPYGARTADFGDTYQQDAARGADGQVVAGDAPDERTATREYGKAWERASHGSPVGNVRKCHFCLHRLEQGMLPACTSTCIGRATVFGDLNDPDSLVSELAARSDVETLLPHKGTRPRVFYIS